MPMLPVFLIGLAVGIVLSYAWYMYKNGLPSETKIKTQEMIIELQKNDIEALTKLNKKLYKEIEELEKIGGLKK